MFGTASTRPIGDAYFGFTPSAMWSGRPGTSEESVVMRREPGFNRIAEIGRRRPLLAGFPIAWSWSRVCQYQLTFVTVRLD
jgi:hypothetical protein